MQIHTMKGAEPDLMAKLFVNITTWGRFWWHNTVPRQFPFFVSNALIRANNSPLVRNNVIAVQR